MYIIISNWDIISKLLYIGNIESSPQNISVFTYIHEK